MIENQGTSEKSPAQLSSDDLLDRIHAIRSQDSFDHLPTSISIESYKFSSPLRR